MTVGRDGQYCVVEPECPDLYRTFFTTRHTPEENARHGVSVAQRAYRLVFPQQDATGSRLSCCLAGLEPLVTNFLSRNGREVQRIQTGTRILPTPAGLPWELRQAADDSVLHLVQQYDRGLIHFDSRGVSPARLIAQVAVSWPRARIAVVVTRIKDAWRLREQLAEFVPAGQITVFTGKACPDTAGRVVIGTYALMGQGPIELHRRHLLFALNPTEMLTHQHGRDTLRAAKIARVYGLLPYNQKITPYDRDLLQALYGSHGVFVPAHGKIQRPVQVLFTKVHGGPQPGKQLDLLQLKQFGIWKHPVRNRRAVALAKLLAAKDTCGMQARFRDIVSETRYAGRGRIAVLVDNVDHALVLGQRLKEWPIVAGRFMASDGLSAQDQLRLRQGAAENLRSPRLIVTLDGLGRVGRLDTIIRADGGLGIPELDLHVNIHANARRHPRTLTLIDFEDTHHPELRRRSRRRRLDYLDAGWRLLQEQLSDLDRYLAQRPEVQW